jgi:UDP-N-acetylglucosamine acyltransferase
MSEIHPTARIGENVHIGPYCYIGPNTEIGDGTRLEGHVSIGSPPEHRDHFRTDTGQFAPRIGKNCIIREFVTINSGTQNHTVLGDNVVMLRGSHIGHDAIIGDRANLSCNVLIGGHAKISEGANLGLAAAIHQFRSVGPYCMVGMMACVTRHVPPFAKVYGSPAKVQGTNDIGLQRAGLDVEAIRRWFEGQSDWRAAGALTGREAMLVAAWAEGLLDPSRLMVRSELSEPEP